MAQLFRCAGENHLSAFIATFRPHFDNPVGAFYDVKMVLDDKDTVPLLQQRLKGFVQVLHIVEVQSGGGFVKNEQLSLIHI